MGCDMDLQETCKRETDDKAVGKIAGGVDQLKIAGKKHEEILRRTIENNIEDKEEENDFTDLISSLGNVLEHLLFQQPRDIEDQ